MKWHLRPNPWNRRILEARHGITWATYMHVQGEVKRLSTCDGSGRRRRVCVYPCRKLNTGPPEKSKGRDDVGGHWEGRGMI